MDENVKPTPSRGGRGRYSKPRPINEREENEDDEDGFRDEEAQNQDFNFDDYDSQEDYETFGHVIDDSDDSEDHHDLPDPPKKKKFYNPDPPKQKKAYNPDEDPVLQAVSNQMMLKREQNARWDEERNGRRQ